MGDEAAFAWTVRELIAATGGVLLSGKRDWTFSSIGIDSRTIDANGFFIAVKGEKHDGHFFIGPVIEKGVRGILVSENRVQGLPVSGFHEKNICCIQVPDTIEALGKLAAFNRRRAHIPLAAVTGSNGKTSTRGMISSIFSLEFRTLSTHGNFNNHIGLPLTLLKLGPSHEFAVVELGMNKSGEIDTLAEIASPDIGIITNIAPAHLEGLGSIENVLAAKTEILHRIKHGGHAVLNSDDPLLRNVANELIKNRSHLIPTMFGEAENASIRATDIHVIDGRLRFLLNTPEGSIPVTLTSPGKVMISNALAAASAAIIAGLPLEKIKSGLESFSPEKGRMNLLKGLAGENIVDDTYNANPGSMKAAIDTFQKLRKGARGIVVFGDMLELGIQAPDLHNGIGKLAAQSGISRLFAVGKHAEHYAMGAADGGLAPDRITTGNRIEMLDLLIKERNPGDWILIKGSRGAKMEFFVKGLLANNGVQATSTG